MTLHPPKDNILDKILKRLGKRRLTLPPDGMAEIYKRLGPYVTVLGKKESFWKALFRKKRSG